MPLIKAFVCLNPVVTDRYPDFDHLKSLVDLLDIADSDIEERASSGQAISFDQNILAILAKGFSFLSVVVKILLPYQEAFPLHISCIVVV